MAQEPKPITKDRIVWIAERLAEAAAEWESLVTLLGGMKDDKVLWAAGEGAIKIGLKAAGQMPARLREAKAKDDGGESDAKAAKAKRRRVAKKRQKS